VIDPASPIGFGGLPKVILDFDLWTSGPPFYSFEEGTMSDLNRFEVFLIF